MAQPKNFGYGVEEEILRKEVRKFFKDNCDELKLMDLVAQNPDPDREPECLWDKKLWKKMERLGLNKDRLQLAWINATEGEKFASKIQEMQGIVDKVTKEEIEKSITRLGSEGKEVD